MNWLHNATFEPMSWKRRNSAIKKKWKSFQRCHQWGSSPFSQPHSPEHHCVKALTAPWVTEGNTGRGTEGFCFAEENLQLTRAFAAVPLQAFPPYFLAFCSQGFLSSEDPLALGVAQILTLPLKWAGCKGTAWDLVPEKTWDVWS